MLTSGPHGSSEDALWNLLAARGVTWYRLETWGDNGQVKYTCSIPNRQNPHIRRTYEALARDRSSALRAVLDQIDREQPH